MYTDYHLHSEFSDDSRTPMEQQIETAIGRGLQEICFTDHVDYGIKPDWTDPQPITMRGGNYLANVNYPEYFAKLQRMQRMYGESITIRKGLEFGVQRHTIPRYQKLAETWREELDFILLSIHQVEDKEFWTQDFQRGRTQEEYNRRYYQELKTVVEEFDEYDVVAHVDLISRYDKAGKYPFAKIEDILRKILTTVIAHGKGIELNTSSWRYGLDDLTPSRDILRLYRSLGGRILTLGSDAHTPRDVGNHGKEARQILREELGFTEFCTYEKHRPIFHPL